MQRYWPHGYCFYETSKVKNRGSYFSNLSTGEGEAGGWPPFWGQWGLQVETLNQKYSRFRTYSIQGPATLVRVRGSLHLPTPPSSLLSSSCLCLPSSVMPHKELAGSFAPWSALVFFLNTLSTFYPEVYSQSKSSLRLVSETSWKKPGLLVDWTGGGAKLLPKILHF